MKIDKAKNRDKQIHKKKHGMRISNTSIFTLNHISIGKRKRRKQK